MSDDNLVWVLIFGAVIGAAIILFGYKKEAGLPVKSTHRYTASVPDNLTRTYKNLEAWEIERDVDGRLKNINVHREASRSG